ncbi:hypothetical protein [Xenophilus sp. Marseille-Q4582]|uniref:hypothetical protein n=1 Tax=Xenophilus sp. Marseille-Q4582 TaxID=2866600 RepID=UPI001CE40337|nr:hypothetical protein [Xenophilus sp. Marseille-Q4582]
MAKPTRTARQLKEILIERIEALPGMRGQITDVHTGGVRWVDAEPGNPNWYVPVGVQREDYRLDVARVIKQTQLEFDMDTD